MFIGSISFNHISDDDKYYDVLSSLFDCKHLYNVDVSDKIFQMFENDESVHSPFYNIDPDLNYYQDVVARTNTQCNYYRESKCNNVINNLDVSTTTFSV